MKSDLLIAIFCAVFASSGFWGFVTIIVQRRDKRVKNEGKVLRGLAHDRICSLSEYFIKRGYITKEEYENLHDYLYLPYIELDGNGTAKKLMAEVEQLPSHKPD